MSGYDVAATGMYGFMPYNNYPNQVAMMGLYDDCYGPMGFNNGLIGFNPAFGGMDYNAYFDRMTEYQDFMSRYQLRTVQNQRNNEVSINAPMEAIQGTAAVLNEKIVANEQEQIMGAWESYVNAVKNTYPNIDDATANSRAKALYQQIYGKNLIDDIREFGSSSFKQGLLQVLTFGLSNRKSCEQNISELTGQPVSRSERAKQVAGNATGGALVGAAAGVFFGPAGMIIGGLLGAIGGSIFGICKK